MNYKNVKTIAFDADDTLWVNETYFRETEEKFCKMLSFYDTENKIDQELFKVIIRNLPLYGYGSKSFVLSMVESALEISNYSLSPKLIGKILDFGKEMLDHPIQLLEGVHEVLNDLKTKYRLVVATKGDLLEQERKLEKSGLLYHFHHIEIMSEKKEKDYKKLIRHLDLAPSEFLMIGNSLKSDVLPCLGIGANAIHVPFHTTWVYEEVSLDHEQSKQFSSVKKLTDILTYL
ncbi:HAD family hydrolase [Namhaeicola litoreus]|uniref:HAD family hydrolase n=1 Tax=Namhaeicola litoreus TaxID=1052145 RepID=A0ABW3Y6I1_9FLAO